MTTSTNQTIEIAGVRHYLARAAGPSTAGVLLHPHHFGVDAIMTDLAHALAERGLTTLVWNPYPEQPMGKPFPGQPPRPPDSAAVKMLTACVDAMEGELGLRTIGSMGFCMGGRYALVFASVEHRLRATVACYPTIRSERGPWQEVDVVPAAAAITCPVQLIYPGSDHLTQRSTFLALQSTLQGRAAETSILFYAGAGHGFMHNPNPVNDMATKSAMPQIYTFLETHVATNR